jgi:hypothetical protein
MENLMNDRTGRVKAHGYHATIRHDLEMALEAPDHQ